MSGTREDPIVLSDSESDAPQGPTLETLPSDVTQLIFRSIYNSEKRLSACDELADTCQRLAFERVRFDAALGTPWQCIILPERRRPAQPAPPLAATTRSMRRQQQAEHDAHFPSNGEDMANLLMSEMNSDE